MANRLIFILILISLLAGFFFYRPYLFPEKPFPKIEDRLPEARILGRINVTDLADELAPILFNNKVAYRDMIASDFILSQTKNTGINLQKPVYFYISGEDEFGALFHVSDSSKVPRAIYRIKSFFDVQDTIVNAHVIHKISKYKLYVCYERNWLFVYRGNKFVKNYFQIKYADHTSMRKSWRKFLNLSTFQNENLTLFFRSKEMVKQRLDYAAVAFDVDSNNVYLKAVAADRYYFPLQQGKSGPSLIANKDHSKHFLDIHLNIDSLKALKQHFIYTFLQPYAQKINFPLRDFIMGWNGDLSVNIGGKAKFKETFVETDFDDDFNPIEVTKTHLVEREMFSSIMTTSPEFRPFLNKLFAKGYLRKVNDEYFFLMSPPVNIIQKPDIFYLYTGTIPKVSDTLPVQNIGKITYDNAVFNFRIDSITKRELYFNVAIPFNYIDRKYRLPH